MKFSTKIPISKNNCPINYNSSIVSFGSCFAENIEKKLDYFKFQNKTNPFGILFHPLAIEKVISLSLSEKKTTENDVFYHLERWHSFDVHSELSNESKEVFLKQLNKSLTETKKLLLEATHCLITLGTAWVYQHKSTNKIVANCHKIPQTEFEKQLLSVGEIEQSLKNIVDQVRKINPNINFVFTLSPIRHIKDGFVENQRSKAHLITALHHYLAPKTSQSQTKSYYFPSYEIVVDELRDYRFYSEDMLHPNQTAINYIWERFVETNMEEKSLKTMQEVASIQRDLTHKPFNEKSTAHQEFLKKLQTKITSIQKKHPRILFP